MAKIKKTVKKGDAQYTGLLSQPFYSPRVGILKLPFFPDAEQRMAAHRQRVLSELFELFAIDPRAPHRWKALAIELACRHVPGMQVRTHAQKRGGQKIKWRGEMGRKLIHDLESLMKQEQITTVEAAARKLSGTTEWRSFNNNPATLAQRYRQARRLLKKSRSGHFGALDAADWARGEESTD
jgi:hypothetical protein